MKLHASQRAVSWRGYHGPSHHEALEHRSQDYDISWIQVLFLKDPDAVWRQDKCVLSEFDWPQVRRTNGQLYTGITTDIDHRMKQHKAHLLYNVSHKNRESAGKRKHQIKGCTFYDKLANRRKGRL